MTKEEFKKRWESDEEGGGITFDEIAKCAKNWGITSSPETEPLWKVSYLVLKEAQTNDCEEYNFSKYINDSI